VCTATGVVVIGGFCDVDDGLPYNSAAVVDGNGVRTRYRKAHLGDREKEIFSAGTEWPPVVETVVERLGVSYDSNSPSRCESALRLEPRSWPAPVNRPSLRRPAARDKSICERNQRPPIDRCH
jgi:predicted amidohydrolase